MQVDDLRSPWKCSGTTNRSRAQARCRRLRALLPRHDCRRGAARRRAGVRAGALDLGPRDQRRTEGRRRDRADGRWTVGRSSGPRRRRRAEGAGRPAPGVRAGHDLARVARLARAADHVHPRRSGDSLDHFRGPGAVEHDRAGDLQPAPARMEGQLEQRRSS